VFLCYTCRPSVNGLMNYCMNCTEIWTKYLNEADSTAIASDD